MQSGSLHLSNTFSSPLCATGRVPYSRRIPSGWRIPISVKVEKETLGGVCLLLPPWPPGELHQQPERHRHTLQIRAAAGRWWNSPYYDDTMSVYESPRSHTHELSQLLIPGSTIFLQTTVSWEKNLLCLDLSRAHVFVYQNVWVYPKCRITKSLNTIKRIYNTINWYY